MIKKPTGMYSGLLFSAAADNNPVGFLYGSEAFICVLYRIKFPGHMLNIHMLPQADPVKGIQLMRPLSQMIPYISGDYLTIF